MVLPRSETPRTLDASATASAPGLKVGERYSFFTPLEPIAMGGMGSLYKIQIHRDDFVSTYILSHVLSGDVSPRILGIHGKYHLQDAEFEEEVRRRLEAVDRHSFTFQRMLEEMEDREPKLVRAGYVAAAKIPHHDDASIHSRFLREVRSIHNMGDHPNIVKYISCDLVENRPVLITEYFPSLNLAEMIYSSKVSAEWALQAFVSILLALHHAHGRGVIHRDVKPPNVLTDGTNVKITDFGLAKPIAPEPGRTQVTYADQLVGTPAYMAPEQADPSLGPVGEWTDVYQAGLTLFEMLTRRPMYDEAEYRARLERMPKEKVKDPDPRRLILEDVQDMSRMHPHFPRDFDPSLPEEVEKLIMTCCQKQVLERYTCELALEHAEELLRNKVFVHADPLRPPNEQRKRDSRTTLILSASEALLARRAYEEAEAYEKCLGLLGQAEHEADVVAIADLLDEARVYLDRLPRAKFEVLHTRHEALGQGLQSEKDDIDAFRPSRKIALEIAAGYEALLTAVEGDTFYELSLAEVRKKSEALRLRAQQHLERIRRTGLPDRIIGRYLAQLTGIPQELPRLVETLASRKAAFIRMKKEELDAAIGRNPHEAALLVLTLKRALESGEPDDLSRGLLEELEKTYMPRLGIRPNPTPGP
jgi:serine/threonine protein kinase